MAHIWACSRKVRSYKKFFTAKDTSGLRRRQEWKNSLLSWESFYFVRDRNTLPKNMVRKIASNRKTPQSFIDRHTISKRKSYRMLWTLLGRRRKKMLETLRFFPSPTKIQKQQLTWYASSISFYIVFLTKVFYSAFLVLFFAPLALHRPLFFTNLFFSHSSIIQFRFL